MPADRPHVFLITCHDLGRHLPLYGASTVDAPNLSRLAAQGTTFDRAFTTAPQCSPSRAALATGRYPHANGMLGLAHFGWELHESETHAAQHFSALGYDPHLFGLQHVTGDVRRLGFAGVHANGAGNGGAATSATAPEVADAVVAHLSGPLDTPLYAEINFFEPHRPYDFGDARPDDRLGVDLPPWVPDGSPAREEFAALQGAIRVLDTAVGRILSAIEDAGIADDSIVVFTTDHGLAMPRAKCTLYDPGVETALTVRWPSGGVAAGRRVGELVSNIDLLPTLLSAVGAEVPETMHGRSFLPLLRGAAYQPRTEVFAEKTFHSYYDPMRSVRTERYCYVRNFENGFLVEVPGDIQLGAIFRADPGRYSADRPAIRELYDLAADPGQTANVADDPAYAEVVADLDARLREHMVATDDPLCDGPVTSPPYRR